MYTSAQMSSPAKTKAIHDLSTMMSRLRTEYLVHHQGHSDTAGRQADGATRTVKKGVPKRSSLGRTRVLQLLTAAPWLDPPRPTRAVGWCGLSVGLLSCRIHQHPPSQGRACIRTDAIAIQSRGNALEVASDMCTMVGFDGDTRWRKG